MARRGLGGHRGAMALSFSSRRHRILGVALACVALASAPSPSAAKRPDVWQWPTGDPVPVVSSFAPPAHDWLPGRRGVTLAYGPGRPVYACAQGTVSLAGRVGGRGVVSIRHTVGVRSIWSTYLPIDPRVTAGETVEKGAEIGTVSQDSTTLHWGAKTGRTAYVNPLRLTVGPPRLLPWDGDERQGPP